MSAVWLGLQGDSSNSTTTMSWRVLLTQHRKLLFSQRSASGSYRIVSVRKSIGILCAKSLIMTFGTPVPL